jgi:putative transcriptional regulator
MTKQYRSEAHAAIHETMEALAEVGSVDKQTMREFDDACLAPVRVLSPDEIRSIRMRERVSQPVFARYLNVSKNLVSDWERGVKRPGGPALRLLAVIEKKGLRAIA